MAFKRYDGFVGSAPQKKMDQELTKCPFCGEDPHWLLELQMGFKSKMTCMCEKCGGKLYAEENGIAFDDNMRVVDTGLKNLNNLSLNSVYHIKALGALAQKTGTGEYKGVDATSGIKSGEMPPITVTSAKKKLSTAAVVFIILGILLVVATFTVIIVSAFGQSDSSTGENSSVTVSENKEKTIAVTVSSMEVEEAYGYYTVTIAGKATNNTAKDRDYVGITLNLYDDEGNVVGTAYANQAGLGKGETWLFSAIGINSSARPTSCKVVDVTYW